MTDARHHQRSATDPRKGGSRLLKRGGRALCILCVAAVVTLLLTRWYEKYLLERERLHALTDLSTTAHALSTAVDRRFALLEALHAFVKATPSGTRLAHDFPPFAAGLHSGATDVRNFGIAPQGVMRYVYPLQGNKQALGHDLLHDRFIRDDVERAVRIRGTALSPPYQLRQGGLGLVARRAVFADGSLWGFVTMVLDVPSVMAEAGLDHESRYRIALVDRGKKVFYGDRRVVSEHPVTLRIALPDGYWEVAAAPAAGWRVVISRELLVFGTITFSGAVLLLWGVYRAVTRQSRLRAAVLERTVELSDSMEYNRALFESSAIGLALCRMDGSLVDVNPAFAAIVGRTVEETLGLTSGALTPERYADEEAAQLEALAKRGVYGPYEKEYLRKDGGAVPVRTKGCILERGGERFIWSSVEDISERRSLELRLRERNEQLSLFVEHAPVAIAMFDRDMKYLMASRRWLTDFRIEGEEVVGRSHYELFPHLPQRLIEVHRRTLAGESQRAEEDRYTHPDGSVNWLRWAALPWYGSTGEIGGIIVFSEDITQRKIAEMALTREHNFSEALIDSLPGVLYLYDRELRFIRWNRNFEKVVQYSTEEIRQMSPLDFFTGSDRELIAQKIAEVFEKGSSSVEAAFAAKDGTRTSYFFTGQKVQFDATPCLLGVGIDISVRKRLEEELTELNLHLEARVETRTRELQESRLALVNLVEDLNEKSAQLQSANEKLQEMDRLKSLFIASMSHELRTPLNSVIGYTSVLMNEWVGGVSAEQQRVLAIVLRAGKHLLSLINDVIDVSKVEAGQIDVYVTRFDLFDVVSEACQQLEGEIKGKSLAFQVENAHVPLETDRRRLLQVILNLLSNAVKYTETGTVSVSVRPEGESVAISVSDTGIGISEEDLGQLFRPFMRAQSHLRNAVSGTGLGLYLTNKLTTDILEGSISCISSVGKGSAFTLRLPTGVKSNASARQP